MWYRLEDCYLFLECSLFKQVEYFPKKSSKNAPKQEVILLVHNTKISTKTHINSKQHNNRAEDPDSQCFSHKRPHTLHKCCAINKAIPVLDVVPLPCIWQKTVRVKSSAQNMIVRSITMLPILYQPLRQRSRSHFQAQQGDRHHANHRWDIQMTPSYWCLQHLKLTPYKNVLPFTRRACFWYKVSSSYMAKDWMNKVGCAECDSKEHNTFWTSTLDKRSRYSCSSTVGRKTLN